MPHHLAKQWTPSLPTVKPFGDQQPYKAATPSKILLVLDPVGHYRVPRYSAAREFSRNIHRARTLNNEEKVSGRNAGSLVLLRLRSISGAVPAGYASRRQGQLRIEISGTWLERPDAGTHR